MVPSLYYVDELEVQKWDTEARLCMPLTHSFASALACTLEGLIICPLKSLRVITTEHRELHMLSFGQREFSAWRIFPKIKVDLFAGFWILSMPI